jgi:YesN/AraC family two-component response regulator
MSISEIAEHVGIPDPSYFSKVFMKSTGTQPNKYRFSKAALDGNNHEENVYDIN